MKKEKRNFHVRTANQRKLPVDYEYEIICETPFEKLRFFLAKDIVHPRYDALYESRSGLAVIRYLRNLCRNDAEEIMAFICRNFGAEVEKAVKRVKRVSKLPPIKAEEGE